MKEFHIVEFHGNSKEISEKIHSMQDDIPLRVTIRYDCNGENNCDTEITERIRRAVRASRKMNKPDLAVVKNLMDRSAISESEAQNYVDEK